MTWQVLKYIFLVKIFNSGSVPVSFVHMFKTLLRLINSNPYLNTYMYFTNVLEATLFFFKMG